MLWAVHDKNTAKKLTAKFSIWIELNSFTKVTKINKREQI